MTASDIIRSCQDYRDERGIMALLDLLDMDEDEAEFTVHTVQ